MLDIMLIFAIILGIIEKFVIPILILICLIMAIRYFKKKNTDQEEEKRD